MLEEVVVLVGGEGHQHPHGAGQSGVDQGVHAAGDQVGFLEAENTFKKIIDLI